MLKHLLENKRPLLWIIIHAFLGGLSILSPWFIISWFYFILLTSLLSMFRRTENHFVHLTGLITYIISFELLARMSGTSPYVPYEMGKYLLFILLVFGIILGYRKGKVGWIMLFLLIPGALIDESGQVGFKNIIFNLLGPVNVALAIVFFKGRVVSEEDFKTLLRLILLPMISVLAFVIIKTPDFADVDFNLRANFETSGGWGTNQVSTALGLGAFLTFLFWRKRFELSGFKWLDLVLLFLFVFRGLLTFSRGGMLGGALGISVLLIYETRIKAYTGSMKRILITLVKIIPIAFLFILIFRYADRISEGSLLLRYQGETIGTLTGTKEKTLNVYTSNRVNVFNDDLNLWREYPLLGVGVGASSHLRENTRFASPHVELSRLISEHGIPGLVYFIFLCWLGFKIFVRARYSTFGAIILALFMIALFTTFHSAMRTFISPLLIGLSMILVSERVEEEVVT